jgi:uncharacterized membrane protein YjgN (DUF898 family)
MSFLVALVLPLFLCAVMAGVTSALWWRTLGNPVVFGIAAFLLTLGLHRVLQAIAEFVKFFSGGGYFLEVREKPDVVQLAKESLNTETIALCLLLVVVGVPLLIWLRSAMVKA